ncbi:cell division FtsZ family protein [Candidatus Parcubacteria bacterium]|nr:cell division FtsZ family protein [Candidatus Parcubacteria bacterium]
MLKKPKKTIKKRKIIKRVKTKAKARAKKETDKVKKTKIKVIGIGGGGNSIVSEIASRMKKANFVVANTDIQALKSSSRRAAHFQFGLNLTQGLGTGMNTELGMAAAQDEKDRIKKMLENQDLVILVVSLGGGTGSGAAPIFAKICKDLGNLCLGIFTLPFEFEGEKKMEIAKNSLAKLKYQLNAFSVIPNERIFRIIDEKTPLKMALSAINKSLTESLEGLIETIYEPGLINIDFADLKTILSGQGKLAYLNTIEIQKKRDTAKEAIEKVLNSPLYPYSIKGAKGILLNISGPKDLGLFEVSKISKTISDLLNKEAKIIFGVSHNKKNSNVIKTTLLATGIPSQRLSLKKPAVQKKVLPKKTLPKKKRKRKVSKPSKITKPIKKIKKTKPIKPIKPVKPVQTPKNLLPKVIDASAGSAPIISIHPEEKHLEEKNSEKVRKNALQIKKEVEETEKKMNEQEKIWETPTFLRRKHE